MTRPKIEIEVNSIPCPFSRCRQQVALLRHAPASDRLDESVVTVEQHVIAGPNYWYQTWCPASHLLIPLSDRGREVLAEHEERWITANAQRINEFVSRGVTNYKQENERIQQLKRIGELGHLNRPGEDYYPPRPSDTEEAEADRAGKPFPAHVEGHQIKGRSHVTSANENTISLIALAKTALGSAQEDCSAATNIVELLDSKLMAIEQLLMNAGQLVAAAAMNSASNPQRVDEAAGLIALADTANDDASAKAAGVLTEISQAFASATQAIDKLDEFIAQISA